MDYLTAEIKGALIEEGTAFCEGNSITFGTFDGDNIVRADDVRVAMGKDANDPSKYWFMHEIPHVVWALENRIYGV